MEKAYILLSCEIAKEQELASQLSIINEIKNVMITYGDYDIVVEAETENALVCVCVCVCFASVYGVCMCGLSLCVYV